MLEFCLFYLSGIFVTLGLVKFLNKYSKYPIDKIELYDAIMLSSMSWVGFAVALLVVFYDYAAMLYSHHGKFYEFVNKLKRWIEE